ncbi:MAG: DNA topoisomerase [Ruminococcaceae bacterium]|nr:DNA topoisomerase [Oscillospiraceae bacterium]
MATKKTMPIYDNNAITQLKGADRVRKRPAVIFGSDGLEGCEHSVFEILSNSVDEAREGHGNIITLTAEKDHTVTVEDCGRGIPLGYNEKEKRYNWDLIFCELYAGGKYNNNDSGAYEYALGLNGLGACATQYSSEFMDVYSYDGENRHEIHFKKGKVVGKLISRPLEKGEKKRGTVIRWRPDLAVFTDIDIPNDYFTDMMKRQAVVNPGIRFVLKIQGESGFQTEEFLYEDGILDRVKEFAGESAMTEPVFWNTETQGRDRADLPEYKVKMNLAFCVSNRTNVLEYYHNSSYLENGGSPDKAVRSAFVSGLDKYLKNTGKYKKNEGKINFSDIADCLVLVSSGFSTQTSYANQTKKAITNTFIADAMTDWIKRKLEIYFTEKPLEAEKFANQVLINKRSRESAESTRLDIRKKLSGTMDMTNRVEKFVGCRSKDPEIRELYIVEGDSAMTSVKLARNAEFQAVIPVRGKTLNCLKASYDRIFKSDIITDLLKVIGCGVEIKGKQKGDIPTFNYDNLRWSKIIICTDADEDGFQIRTLLLTLFYRLLPTLIEKGKIYIAETPLFQVETKDNSLFAYNEWEKAEILKNLEGKKYTLHRFKGLGENTAEMMGLTTMNPATRRLIRVTPTDAAETFTMFDTLLGDNLPARKEFIQNNAGRYAKDADI